MNKKTFGEPKYFIEDIVASDKPEDPIILDAFNRIWDKLKKDIFIWREFNTDLPFCTDAEPDANKARSFAGDQYKKDLQAMCFDEKGQRKSLNTRQRDDIANTGRFTVKSLINEKYDNVWMLGSFLQLGRSEINRRLKHRRNEANKHWFLYLPEYLSKDNPRSLYHALSSMKQSCFHLPRILFGLPEYRPRYADEFIDLLVRRSRLSFLVEEARPLTGKELIWQCNHSVRLNALLARPEVRQRLGKIIEQLTQKLNDQGEILDSALLQAVLQHPKTVEIDPDLPALLEKFHSFYYQLSENNPAYRLLLDQEITRTDALLRKQFPYRGRYDSWRKARLEKHEYEIIKQVQQHLAHNLSETLTVGQEQYCLNRNIAFNEECEYTKRKQLEAKSRYARIFNFPQISWSLKSLRPKECLPVVNKHMTTNRPLWRIRFMLYQAYNIMSNSALKIMRALLYHPMGIKSVLTLSKDRFKGEQWLKDDGCPYKSDLYPTYLTDLDEQRALIKKYRKDFESKSDFGLFPRSIGRLFNQFYCYVMIGVIGGVIMLVVRYVSFIIFSLVFVLALLLAPAWAPLYALFRYIYNAVIYDSVGPVPYYQGRVPKPYPSFAPVIMTLGYHFLIRGVLFALINLSGMALHLFATPLFHITALLMYSIRTAWDLLMRVVFIYPFARIPGDNFPGLVTRIAGYGIANDVLNQVGCDDALEKYRDWLEGLILNEYESLIMSNLYLAYERLDKMMTAPYKGIIGDRLFSLQKILEENAEPYKQKFESRLYACRSKLQNRMGLYQPRYLRLSAEDLPKFMNASASLTKHKIETNLMEYMSDANISEFWQKSGINMNDWEGLSRVYLAKAFSADIFTPMEECDSSIHARLDEHNMMSNLLLKKEPSAKVVFEVISDAMSPEATDCFAFKDNRFWSGLYHSLYIPIETDRDWAYLQYLRGRAQ